MLEVRLRHSFPGFALDAAFTAGPGVTALFGPSGCGKSTILAAIAGLLRPDEGRVALAGEALLDTRARRFVAPERRRCAVVFQEGRLFPHLSVEGNLRYGLRRAPAGAEGPGFETVVALLGLGALLGRRPRALSGGEKQRVALGRALLSRPRLLLMDEPLAALDAPRRAEILPFLARLRDMEGPPILYVTHALEEVDALADALVLLEGGRVLAQGSPDELSLRADLPLAARRDAGAVLTCTVAAHEPARGLTRLSFPGGALEVPLRSEAPGARVRIRLRARDIAVARTRPEGISIHNILPCRLMAITPSAQHPEEVLLRLQLGEAVLLSRVLRDAVARLELREGDDLFALLKAVALDHAPG
jgi:molybdate transport system ATP-binding protein